MSDRPASCAIVGATGLVGSALVRLASEDARYDRVRVLARRPVSFASPRVETALVAFEALVASSEGRSEAADQAAHRQLFAVDDVFCCLGTTIQQAGSQAAFRRVDFDYPLAAAKVALAAGARQFVIVTAVGASSTSAIFYNRVKGELEDALRALAFPEGVTVLHPSLLLGERHESRLGERIASVFMRGTRPLFGGPLERYRAIEDHEVANAMLRAAAAPTGAYRVLEGRALFALAHA
jgi:uncharacterized protein YbjT (DUF2867 family)